MSSQVSSQRKKKKLKYTSAPMDLNLENLLKVLQIANGSERTNYQSQAEHQLKQWESVQLYHYLLQTIYLNKDLELQLRWLAVICFKNGIDRYWRSTKVNAISKEEKSQIRARLFDGVLENNNQLTIQNAHSVSRIVRFDFPNEWPSLFDDFYNYLHDAVFVNENYVCLNNLLIMLNQIIKTLASVRIGRARHAMQSKVPVVVPLLIKLYVKFFKEWTTNLDLTLMEVCYLCLKNLRRIIPEGYDQPHKDQDINEFLKISVIHLQGLIQEHDKYSSDLIERYTKCHCKLYLNLISINPTSFVLLQYSGDIISTCLGYLETHAEVIYNSSDENDFWENIALKSFLVLKKLITYVYKQGAVTVKQHNDIHEINSAITKLKDRFLTPEIIQHLCDLIITWYLKLKPSDLETWLLDPEEWTNEEFSSSWEYQIRLCSENFFQDLIKYFKDDLAEFILSKMSIDLGGNVLIQDSILCTFQLSSDSISERVNFNALLKDVFIPLGLRNTSPEDKIIKRRICLIINIWVNVDCSNESRVEIYRLLLNFLDSNNEINDKVVQLSAIQCLKTMIEDWDFVKQDFQPYLKDFIASLVSILKTVTFTESKLFILNTIASIIEKCNPLIDYQSLISILSIIPEFWTISESENETILKNSLLRILKNLVASLNENSPETYSISIPLVKECCKENSQDYALLAEDGYELWVSLLQYCPQSKSNEPALLHLFDDIQYGLMNSTEVLPLILSIIRSYSLMDSNLFLGEVSLNMFRILSGYLSNMRDDAFSVFTSLMEILFLEKSGDQGFIKNLLDSGLFNSMVQFVLDESQPISNINKILLVLSRLSLAENNLFLEILTHLSSDPMKFLRTWLDYFNNNGNPRNKKINLLAFLSLAKVNVPKQDEFFMSVFPEIIRKTLLFLEEVQEDDLDNVEAYNLNLFYEDIDDYRYLDSNIKEKGEKIRYNQLLQNFDPVHKVHIKSQLTDVVMFIKDSLTELQFNQLMSLNDEYSIERLQQLL